MKASLKANLLKHFIAKKEEGGFTLIELLVVIIIIGILAAIALPSFLNQANKARQSEAKTYVGSMNRGQQAYRLENPTFAPGFVELAIGIPSQTTYYNYTIGGSGNFGAAAFADRADAALKSYVGGVQLSSGSATEEATTIAVLCESVAADEAAVIGALTNFAVGSSNNDTDCAGGWKRL
ncbi:type IV pilin-like G/H family protein [Leptolyngbya sp. CCNP1308]|uniref:type IV pilin-like G/H family protein n=1 Tax=Leptolyngbya sp. CCNP1308 TaxID=3110255 RepID=UPI002B205CB4|nr:type IV pilin-like G/H family protein [Leptolyngbya sp. CCNP1308]MEA5451566.1 type IV pilin-like G/H family protein [Leptolyngbya sp. CCNP1308]